MAEDRIGGRVCKWRLFEAECFLLFSKEGGGGDDTAKWIEEKVVGMENVFEESNRGLRGKIPKS